MACMLLTIGIPSNTEKLCGWMAVKSFLKFEYFSGGRPGAVRHWCTFLFPPTGTDS